MDNNEKNELVSHSADIALSAAGSLVGLVIGGPVGAVAGGILPPATKLAFTAGQMWLQRRKARITNIIESAFNRSGKSEEAIFQEMIEDPDWCDTIISMIRQLADSDPELDHLFSDILASVIRTDDQDEKNRLIVLYNAIKGLNKVQIFILKDMYLANGVLSAHDIADHAKVPELELRNAVRDLELRGMILDNGKEPTVWHLRELGTAIARAIEAIGVMEDKE